MWKFVCFNGSVFEYQGYLLDAIRLFKIKTGLHELDIKQITQGCLPLDL